MTIIDNYLETIRDIQSKIIEVQSEVKKLEKEKQTLVDIFKQRLVKEKGFTRFVMESKYYGSHSEYYESDEDIEYFFAPHVDTSLLSDIYDFKHGHFSCSKDKDKFNEFLKTLTHGVDYLDFDLT